MPLALFFLVFAVGLLTAHGLGALDAEGNALIAVVAVALVLLGVGVLVRTVRDRKVNFARAHRELAEFMTDDEDPSGPQPPPPSVEGLQQMLREMERSGNRAQWMFFVLGVAVSIPAGILVNLLTG